jgi:hypothetical protein
MRNLASVMVLSVALASLTGCAPTSPYGNFVKEPVAGLDQNKIANDTLQQLVTLYSPARTQFELQQPTTDPYGHALVENLRAKGYAIQEFNSGGKAVKGKKAPRRGSARTASLPLCYIFDQTVGMDLYRITVMVGDQSVTRLYVPQDGTTVPAGYWVRKE